MEHAPPLGLTFWIMNKEFTYQSVLRYMQILPAEKYQMTLMPEKKTEGNPIIRAEYKPESLRKAIEFLNSKNKSGYHIYCRPVNYRYIMLDDLIYDEDQEEESRRKFEKLADMKPCMLIRTSREHGTRRDNYQAWFKLGFEPEDYDHALEISRYLQQTFATDVGGNGPHQPARLPGYLNVKAKYLHVGSYPIVKIRKSQDRISTITPGGARAQSLQEPNKNQAAINGISKSEVDFAIACKMVREGKDNAEVAARLEQNLSGRRKGRHYIPMTINNARKAVQKEIYQSELTNQHSIFKQK